MFNSSIMDLLKALIVASEKAANVARVCRADEHLFELLVQKKGMKEANPRFVEDFKTLADVLIQEMVKHDVSKQFPALSDSIKGEENNTFENTLNERICVEVKPTEEETSHLIEKVLNGDKVAADLLAKEVHKDIKIEDTNTTIPEDIELTINLEELGIWIDPIDCTTEYIHGGDGDTISNIHLNGLQCVTILMGVFNKITGCPIIGVINRPFLDETCCLSEKNCIWGVHLENIRLNSGLKNVSNTRIICVSSSETDNIQEKLKEAGFILVPSSGAGYKILTVILGLADAYIITKGTTFKWDTCAPHAILKTLNGDIVNCDRDMHSIIYSVDGNNCNSKGIIVYRHEDVAKEMRKILGFSQDL